MDNKTVLSQTYQLFYKILLVPSVDPWSIENVIFIDSRPGPPNKQFSAEPANCNEPQVQWT